MFRTEENVEKVREALRKMGEGRKFLQPDSLLKRINRSTKLDSIAIGEALKAIKEKGEIESDDWAYQSPFRPLRQVRLNLRPLPLETYEKDWIMVLDESGLSADEAQILKPMAVHLQDFDLTLKKEVLNGLCRLRSEQDQWTGKPKFNVSSAYFLGSSKLLDNLPVKNLTDFGIQMKKFGSAPNYIVVAGPKEPEAVILVENPHSFEMAVNSKGNAEKCAWISTFGYRLSNLSKATKEKSEDIGELINFEKLIPVVREGNPPNLSELFVHKNIQFWGDLDLAGLDIFVRLKKKIPNIQLSSLYHPMITLLKQGKGHPYVKIVDKEGQQRRHSNDDKVEMLLDICETRGIDQECIGENDIAKLAGIIFSSIKKLNDIG